MAAATNKPGPVHYTLVVTVFLVVVLGLLTYHFYSEAATKEVENQKVKQDNQNLTKNVKDFDDSIQAMKQKIGIKLDRVDDPTNPQNQATVVAALMTDLATYGKDVAGKDVQETVRKMREAIDTVTADRDAKVAKIASLEKEVLGLKSQYQSQVDNYSGQAKASERDKLAVIGDRDEKVDAKIQEITRLNQELKSFQIQLEDEKESSSKRTKEMSNTITGLETRIDTFRERIDNLEKLSFEVAKGLISSVDHSNHSVLINLGEDDFLKTRMTFSVYTKENQGVGRGAEDIKGKIEVTRILGPHLAEAKITDEDLFRPIIQQDLIYTPIWTPGLIEKVSIIGDIDLDNDGRSDREQLHQMLTVAGCQVDNEVDENGDRVPEEGKITVQTRFLVKGNIPDLANALTDEEKTRAQKIAGELTKMEKEARTNGVRIIKLNDFLAYIGFHSKRRTFLPGQSRPFNLKAGLTGTADGPVNRESNGAVSGAFKKGRKKGHAETESDKQNTEGQEK